MEIFWSLVRLISQSFSNFFAIDWSLVNYRQEPFAWQAGYAIAGLYFMIFLWKHKFRRREKSAYDHSGFEFSSKNRPGLIYRAVHLSVFFLVVIGTGFFLLSLASPYLVVAEKFEQKQSREIVYNYDASASMGFPFKGSRLSRADFSQTILMNILAKRKDKGDRSAYIVFATEASIYSFFTHSTESIMFVASKAPKIIAPSEAHQMWPGIFIAKEFTKIDVSSETNLHLGLQETISLFDRKGSKEISEALAANPDYRMRSVVIITDGAASQDPEKQFIELRKRRIIPFLVFIDPDLRAEMQIFGQDSPRAQVPTALISMVRRYGGQVFFAKDHDSPEKISDALDRLHTIKNTVKAKAKERDVYYVPLALSCFAYVGAILIRFVTIRLWRTV